jgi:hypothetical protein
MMPSTHAGYLHPDGPATDDQNPFRQKNLSLDFHKRGHVILRLEVAIGTHRHVLD